VHNPPSRADFSMNEPAVLTTTAAPTPAPAPRPSFWRRIRGRLPTPSLFLLAVVLFPLPWIELSCQNDVMITQSGLEAIYGGASPGPAMGGPFGGGQVDTKGLPPAPVMGGYAFGLLAALLAGLCLP